MKEIESAMSAQKASINCITAPEEMESRLREALIPKRRSFSKLPVVAALVAILLLTYSFDALAYYGRKLTGYENVMTKSLKQLNEEGRGQEINKTVVFSNGEEVTLVGIMFDQNQLVAFYKLYNKSRELDYNTPDLQMLGLKPLGYSRQGGHGYMVDKNTWTMLETFEPPQFYEKWMKLQIRLRVGNKIETREIPFTLDRNKAANRVAKERIYSETTIKDYKIRFNGISASSMSTVVDGSLEPLTKAASEALIPETAEKGFEIPRLVFDIVDDKGNQTVFYCGGGTSGEEFRFTGNGDALPEGFKSLEIKNIRLITSKLVDKSVDITPDTVNLLIGDDLEIKKVYAEADETCVVISSRGVPVVGMFLAGDTEAEGNGNEKFDRDEESIQPVERVFRFKGKAENMKLAIKSINYSSYSKDTINIPLG